jgi:hypothetical protein
MLSAEIKDGPSTCKLLLNKMKTKHGQTSGLVVACSPMAPVSSGMGCVQNVSADFLFHYSATNGSTRGYSATFCTLVPGVSLPQDAS